MHSPPQHVDPDPVLHSQPDPPSNAVPVKALLSQSLHPFAHVPNGGGLESEAVLHAPPKQALLELVVLQSHVPSELQSEYPGLHAVHVTFFPGGGIRHSHLSVQQPDWHPTWSSEQPCNWLHGLDPEGQHNCFSVSQHNLDCSSYDIPSPQSEQGHIIQNLQSNPNTRASTRAPRIPNSVSLFLSGIRIE